MSNILNYIGNRLKENSTRVAILGFVLGITGIVLSPEQTEAIMGLAGAITVAIIAFLPDNPAE